MTRNELREQFFRLTEKERLIKDHPQPKGFPDKILLFPSVRRDAHNRVEIDPSELHFTLLEGKVVINKQTRYMDLPLHRHDFIGINYLYNGEAELHINNTVRRISEGDVCIMDREVAHTVTKVNGDTIVLNIQLDPDFFSDTILLRFSSGGIMSSFVVNALKSKGKSGQFVLMHAKESERVRYIIEDLFLEAMDEGLCSEEFLTGLIVLLLIEMFRFYEKGSKIHATTNDMACTLGLLRMIDRDAINISLQKLSDQFGLSPKYIGSLVKQNTGKSFKTLQGEYRQKQALLLLTHSDLSVEEIARQCGYGNLTFFYRKFKERQGMTPQEYRLKGKPF